MLPRPDPAARLIGTASERRGTVSSSRRDLWVGLDHGSIMGMELLAAILTWTAIGWLLDRWLSTTPWLLAAGAIIGNAAGLYLIWLRSKQMNDAEEARRERARAGRDTDGGPDVRMPATEATATREEGRGI